MKSNFHSLLTHWYRYVDTPSTAVVKELWTLTRLRGVKNAMITTVTKTKLNVKATTCAVVILTFFNDLALTIKCTRRVLASKAGTQL